MNMTIFKSLIKLTRKEMFRRNVVCLADITFCYKFDFLQPASNFLTIHVKENKQAFKIILLLFWCDLLLNTANYSCQTMLTI